MKISTVIKVASAVVAVAAAGATVYSSIKAKSILEQGDVDSDELEVADTCNKVANVASKVAVGAAVVFCGSSAAEFFTNRSVVKKLVPSEAVNDFIDHVISTSFMAWSNTFVNGIKESGTANDFTKIALAKIESDDTANLSAFKNGYENMYSAIVWAISNYIEDEKVVDNIAAAVDSLGVYSMGGIVRTLANEAM